MIIVKLKGGLGNQLFQYAAGRRLAEVHKTILKMDTTAYYYGGPRQYELNHFNIRENVAVTAEIEKLIRLKQSKVQRFLHGLFHNHPKRPPTYICNNHSDFNPEVLNLPDNIYLEGYWCSEKYFIDIADIIRKEFTVKTPQTGKNKELAELINLAESVSIHIRRGDYIEDQKAKQSHDICTLDYYYNCIEHVTSELTKPHFFIFSDNPLWCKNNLQLLQPATFVGHNGPSQSYEDLRLMSQCRHNIIANSTFSWWGAWLNPNKDKLVLAPRKWLARKDKNSKDIIPSQWIAK
ncbi:O-antigen biosynthesis glycosyltransferase WbnK [subsurface metagenome]